MEIEPAGAHVGNVSRAVTHHALIAALVNLDHQADRPRARFSFPEELQGEISGLSRAVSNLGSSLGTAIAGTVLVSGIASGNRSYALAMITLAAIGLIGLVAALLLPAKGVEPDVHAPPHAVASGGSSAT